MTGVEPLTRRRTCSLTCQIFPIHVVVQVVLAQRTIKLELEFSLDRYRISGKGRVFSTPRSPQICFGV
ncbi:hypothetical protein PM082_012704 [Marasmius tenuissimus]|nr:hypothetical protein PM082_012704 [Marasmius tenuissimus]